MVVGALDVGPFCSVGKEAAFEKDGRVLDVGDDGVAGPADASVATGGVFDDGGVDGGGKGDVGGVVIVTGLFAKVGGFEPASVVGDAFGGEGEGLDTVGTTAATGVKVEGDEDGVGVLVGEVDALLKGEIFVGAASEADFEAALAELGGELFSEAEGVVLFASVAVRAGGAGVVSAVTGVDDDGVDAGGGATDVVGPHHGVEKLDEVDAVHEVAAAGALDGEGENEFDLIHPNVLLSDEEFDADVALFEDELGAGGAHGGEAIELLDAANGDVVFLADDNIFPSFGALRG